MALVPRTLIDPPVTTPPPYGLYSVARVTDDGPDIGPDQQRWEAGGIEFTSTACAQGTVWAIGCGPAFTVVLTKTVTANQWSADMTPNVGPYEISIAGAAFVAILDGGVFLTAAANATVVIRETTGLRRQVGFTGVSNVAANGTQLSGTSSTQAFNNPKTGDGKSFETADPFTVLAGVACGALGTLNIDDQARARAALAAAEERLVSATFERGNIDPRLAAGGGVVLPAGPTAIRLRKAVGALETYLRQEYGGTGVLHMPPALAQYMCPIRDGAVLRTYLGTPIAFASGYEGVNPEDGEDPGTGTLWIYATGAVTVRRSPVVLPAVGAETLNRETNQTLMIAERQVIVAIDCVPVAAALVDLTAEDQF